MSELSDKLSKLPPEDENSLFKVSEILGFEVRDLPRLLDEHFAEKLVAMQGGAVNEDAIVETLFKRLGPFMTKQIDEAAQKVELRIANKVAVIAEEVGKQKGGGGGEIDFEKIVIAVYEKMKLDIAAISQQTAAIVKADLEAKFKAAEAQAAQQAAAQNPGAGAVTQNGAAGGIIGIFRALLQEAIKNPEGIKTLVSIFRPATPADPIARLSAAYKIHKMLKGMEVDGKGGDELIEEITKPAK